MNTWHLFRPSHLTSQLWISQAAVFTLLWNMQEKDTKWEVGLELLYVGLTINCIVFSLPHVHVKQLHKAGAQRCSWVPVKIFSLRGVCYSFAMVWCTLKWTKVPDVSQVKLYRTLGWSFHRWGVSDVYQTWIALLNNTSKFHDGTTSCFKTNEWTMSYTLPHEGKQASQPVECESHSFSRRTSTKTSFLSSPCAVWVGCPQWKILLLQQKRSWLDLS